MNQTRFQALLQGQTAVAQRVFEAVPISEAWSTGDIFNELQRQGKARDFHVVEGCLNRLKQASLVSEPARGMFRRAKVHTITTQPQEDSMPPSKPSTPVPAKKAPTTAVEHLAPLTARLIQLANDLKGLATEIETAALEIDQSASESTAALEKLAQFRNLLNTI